MSRLEVASDGTIEGTVVNIEGKPAQNIKRIILDIDPAQADAFPSLKVSVWRDAEDQEKGAVQALVDCHGKKFKLEIE